LNRSRRLALVAQLVGGRRFSSQDELVKALAGSGVEVTQATLSRDLRSLGVARRPDAEGRSVYELPGPAVESIDRQRRLLDLRTFVNDVRVAQNLVVVRTPPGHANGVGRAIDLADFEGVIGTVAGDDTVLVIMERVGLARGLKQKLDAIAASGTVGAGTETGGSAK
jgi:transcriptional regulator of arginine metabolism